MGEVVNFAAARAQKDAAEAAKDFIDDAYERLEALPDFTARESQRALSRAVYDALVKGYPLAAEAPTGTGKTLAYLVAGLAAQHTRPTPTPLIVATATVGLQEQILSGDLPKLARAQLIDPSQAALAKGRGRYFCMLSAERVLQQAQADGQFDFFDGTANDATVTYETAREMLTRFHTGAWNGDRDHYLGQAPAPAVWPRLQASADTCIGRRCEHFAHCPFFRARARMATARLIVANQDLVLADLTMARDKGQEPLFPCDDYLLIVDEAHHLPDKALNNGASEVCLEAAQSALLPLPAWSGKMFRDRSIADLLDGRSVHPRDFEPGPALAALAAAAAAVRAFRPDSEDDSVVRLGRGALPAELDRAVRAAHATVEALAKNCSLVMSILRNTTLPERKPQLIGYFSEVLFQASFLGTRVAEIEQSLKRFLDGGKVVRWLDHTAERARLHVSPLEGADVLRGLLWETERTRPVLVSATLRTFGNFDRFSVRAGLPVHARTYHMPPIFDYSKSELVVANLVHSPRHAERPEFEAEVSTVLPQFLRAGEAALVLFPSRALMQRALPMLRERWGEAVLAQNDLPFARLIEAHKARTDEGKTSILCGLATLAEGLDLPGRYCTHVVIVALPFSVPTGPIEMEIKAELGDRYFPERALPDALTHLIQMVGRLIRRESDQGRITVLDQRLAETRWGRAMLRSLPPFTRRRERRGDRVPGAPADPAKQPSR